MRAVILAGGLGTRLKPYTTSLPKPLMPINGELPILEIILRQLKGSGFERVTLATGHLSEIIQAFFGDGAKWGLSIDYSYEDTPLSTIGPLTLIDDLPENFLVMNGDILTTFPFNEFMAGHSRSSADVTVAVSHRKVKVDYGVIEHVGDRISKFVEKPNYEFDVSMGVYAIGRHVVESLERGKPYGFDDLMVDGLQNGLKLNVHPYSGYWLDIGRPSDFDRANNEFDNMRSSLLPST